MGAWVDCLLAEYYYRNMQRRISITLSSDVLSRLDRVVGRNGNRSKLVEAALVGYLNGRRREIRDRTDQKILDRDTDSLNAEAEDVLSYQIPL